MRILSTLKRLAARGPSPWPLLSVYVNTRPVGAQMTTYRPFLKRRMIEELRAFKARSPEHESLSVDFARVQHYLDYDLREETRAVTVFACYAGDDLFEAEQLPVEFPDHLVTVGSVPTLFPLLRMADRSQRAAIAVLDDQAARIFVSSLGAIEVRREVRPAATRPDARPDEPGDLIGRALRVVREMAAESGAHWIVLGGAAGTVEQARAALAGTPAVGVLTAPGWDPRIPEAELAGEVATWVDARERAGRIARAERLVADAARGAAALGVDAVLQALREDTAGELLLSESFPARVPAWACRSCRAFGAGSPPGACPTCGRETIEEAALREELGAQALARGLAVGFVPAGEVPAFEDGGGVGTLPR